jgi:hypothetical protein
MLKSAQFARIIIGAFASQFAEIAEIKEVSYGFSILHGGNFWLITC